MKGVVLAGGRGSRITDLTKGSSKCLLKIANESIVSQNVRRLCNLDEVSECIVVVGYDAEAIMRNLGNCCNSKKISYCIQQEQKGLINALEAAVMAIGNSDFFMALGDEYVIDDNYVEAVSEFYKNDYDCLIGIIDAEDPEQVKKTYTFRRDMEGNMSSFIEKPANPFNTFKGTGNVIFKNKIVQFLKEVPVNRLRGEKELVDLFNLLLDKERTIGSFIVGSSYFNVNTKEEYECLISRLEG